MDVNEWDVGRRIARLRARRGLTQSELAGLVGISLSMMKKIESGDRAVTRLPQLVLFAKALRVADLHELTGVPLALEAGTRHRHPATDAVYAALMNRDQAPAEPVDLERLDLDVSTTWTTWQSPSAFRYASVGDRLPDLLGRAQSHLVSATDETRRAALCVASHVYQLTRTWAKRVGEHDLSMIAADRAVSCALDADDPDLAGAAAWNLAMILSAQHRTEHSRAVIHRAIESITPQLREPSQRRLAVFGSLHLLGAVEAARADNTAEANRLLDHADRIAARTGETNYFHMVFGPANVTLHRVSAAVEFGRTEDALRMVEDLPVGAVQTVERRLTLRLDAARSYIRCSNDIAALHMLQRVHDESPEELRHNSLAGTMLKELRGRAKASIVAEIETLAASANLDG